MTMFVFFGCGGSDAAESGENIARARGDTSGHMSASRLYIPTAAAGFRSRIFNFLWLGHCLSQKKKPEGPSNDGWPAAVAFARSTNVFEARNSEERVLGVFFLFFFVFFWLDE